MANTKITYLYRDADNYKVLNTAIVSGELTHKEIEEICAALEDKQYFIPHQVGLPETRFDDVTEADHPWFELEEQDFEETDEDPTVDITTEELYSAFMEAAGSWDPDAPDPMAERYAKHFPTKYRCPKCSGLSFLATAIVRQEWELNGYGERVRITQDEVSVVHYPDTANQWTCKICGFTGSPKSFSKEEQHG